VSGITVPTLGPIGDDATEVWGFDSRFVSGTKSLSVSDPTKALALMSYGNGNKCQLASSGQYRWISDYNYMALIDELTAPSPSDGGVELAAGSVWDALFVSGIINVSDETAVFQHSRLLPSGRVDFNSSGDYSLDVIDALGGVIASVDFDPEEAHADAPNDGIERAVFNVAVRLPAVAIGRIELRKGQTVYASLPGSQTTPTVDITEPVANSIVTSADVSIAWDGVDGDGDELTYSVYYSADGAVWKGLALNTPDSEVVVSRSQLVASNNGQLLVIVSDGINSSRSMVDLIVIGNNAPTVSILSPGDSDTFSGVQSVFFDAVAYDTEDGRLDGSSVVWTSDLDGNLGSGREIILLASDLSVGNHLITVTATDANGESSSATVSIDVSRIAPPPVDECLVVDFAGDRLFGNLGQMETTSTQTVNLPDGTYEVILESSDVFHGDPSQTDQPSEQWFLEGLDATGNVVLTTSVSDDLPTTDIENETNVGSYDVTGVVSRNSIVPVQVTFVSSSCVRASSSR